MEHEEFLLRVDRYARAVRLLQQVGLVFAFLILAYILTGCTVPPLKDAPSGWPALTRSDHFGVPDEVKRDCGALADGCAMVDLCKATCVREYRGKQPGQSLREHEEGHCQGRDHWLSSVMADLLKRWEGGFCAVGAVQKSEEDRARALFWALLLL